jgi:hypothetical protein
MALAFITNRCSSCGKLLEDGDNGIVLGDIKIQESQIVHFTPGLDTRNVYCNMFCLKKDLDKELDKLKN